MKLKQSNKKTLTAYLFVLPWIIGFIFFTGGPIIGSFLISFTKWNMLGIPQLAGFENYKNIFLNPNTDFYSSLKATAIFTVINVSVTVVASLILATLLNIKAKFLKFFQFAYFIPAVLPSVVMASVFKIIFDKELGVFNYYLSLIGIVNAPNWLSDTFWVFVSLAIVSIFTFSTGQMMLIFNAGLKEVSADLYEAADIDGANFFYKFIFITIPSISPIILFNVVVATVSSFNSSFGLIYPLTGGGPGKATEVLSLNIYRNAFKIFDMGNASALAFILFVIVGIVTIIQFRLSKNSVHYE